MLLQRVCAPLMVTSSGRVPPQKFPEMAAQLRLLRDYIAASADPAIVATLIEEGGPCLQQIHVRSLYCSNCSTQQSTCDRSPSLGDVGLLCLVLRSKSLCPCRTICSVVIAGRLVHALQQHGRMISFVRVFDG